MLLRLDYAFRPSDAATGIRADCPPVAREEGTLPTRIENVIEELVFEVAGELKLTDEEVHRLDVATITALVLTDLRHAVRDQAGVQPEPAQGDVAAAGLLDALRRLALRFREGLV